MAAITRVGMPADLPEERGGKQSNPLLQGGHVPQSVEKAVCSVERPAEDGCVEAGSPTTRESVRGGEGVAGPVRRRRGRPPVQSRSCRHLEASCSPESPHDKMAASPWPGRLVALAAVLAAVWGHALPGSEGPAEDHGSLQLGVSCSFCAAVLGKVFHEYLLTRDPLSVSARLVPLCAQLQLASEDVCQGVVDEYLPAVTFLADHDGNSSTFSLRLCRLLINKDDCVHQDEWTVALDTNKPEVVSPTVAQTSGESVTIVHLTDVHFDPSYTAANTCRSVAGAPPAGHWGGYTGCDVPLRTLRNLLGEVRQRHPKIDYVYFTGDTVDHMIWETTRESNNETITAVVNLFAEFFGNVTVIHTLGNHEPSPVNLFAPMKVEGDNVSTAWLYQQVSELWSPYITEEAKETVLRGGFYTLKLRDGFRVVVLNNAVCYNMNFWLLYQSEDPYGQLAWLAETLLRAERDGEKVHLLYHIPSGSKDCLRTWSREYHRIVDRFENTITAQFNGHTHYDEFHVYYSVKNTSRPISVALNGGSVTSFENVNMNYKVYTVDPSSWYVTDGESWVFNLSEANSHLGDSPKWYKLYSYRDAYGVGGLLPSELDSLAQRMSRDRSLLQKYNRYYFKDAGPSLRAGCDDECLKSRLCDIATGVSGDATQCDRLLAGFEASPQPETTPTTTLAGAGVLLGDAGSRGGAVGPSRHVVASLAAAAAVCRLAHKLP
ncbi:sphingomyelin phosphodiesterase-like [Bacillus rossius redtenbacheri]|uniref:sphingomyelin phosphodiesterase-like n=1 Tax=Bacillus rossius redtenbacheri TaxID=93214 RepID=UPI002FDE2E8F